MALELSADAPATSLRRWPWVAIGLALNLALLLVPPLAISGRAPSGALVWLAALASLFCWLELATCPSDDWSAEFSIGRTEATSRRLMLATGVLLLLEFVVAGSEQAGSAAASRNWAMGLG